VEQQQELKRTFGFAALIWRFENDTRGRFTVAFACSVAPRQATRRAGDWQSPALLVSFKTGVAHQR
jgi:hypothetical protein